MTNVTFEHLIKLLADRLAATLSEEPTRLYPRLLTIEQASMYLGLSQKTVEDMLAERKLSFVHAGRLVFVDRKDLDQWIEENKVGWADLRGNGKESLD